MPHHRSQPELVVAVGGGHGVGGLGELLVDAPARQRAQLGLEVADEQGPGMAHAPVGVDLDEPPALHALERRRPARGVGQVQREGARHGEQLERPPFLGGQLGQLGLGALDQVGRKARLGHEPPQPALAAQRALGAGPPHDGHQDPGRSRGEGDEVRGGAPVDVAAQQVAHQVGRRVVGEGVEVEADGPCVAPQRGHRRRRRAGPVAGGHDARPARRHQLDHDGRRLVVEVVDLLHEQDRRPTAPGAARRRQVGGQLVDEGNWVLEVGGRAAGGIERRAHGPAGDRPARRRGDDPQRRLGGDRRRERGRAAAGRGADHDAGAFAERGAGGAQLGVATDEARAGGTIARPRCAVPHCSSSVGLLVGCPRRILPSRFGGVGR